MEFGRDSIGRNVFVVGGKLVPREAERANPDPGANVDLADGLSATPVDHV